MITSILTAILVIYLVVLLLAGLGSGIAFVGKILGKFGFIGCYCIVIFSILFKVIVIDGTY